MSPTIRYNSILIICLLFLVKLGTNTSKIRRKYVFMYLANPYVTRVYTRKREDGENKVIIDVMICQYKVVGEDN